MNTNVTTSDLIPSTRYKSFYGKAKLIRSGNGLFLKCYDTVVASVDNRGATHRHSEWLSRTVCNHICSFIDQYCTDISTSAEFKKLPVEQYEI